MIKKSIIDTRKFVPEYFGNNREFQVFLRAINLALSVIKADTDNFVPNLLNPLRCKERLLPLLSDYVGWSYDSSERPITNRWITRLLPLLVRNRGNEIGLTLATSIAISLMANPEELNLDRNFSIEVSEEYDKYGRKLERIKIYLYFESYLPLLRKLIELVRPAGVAVDFIPAQSISSSETIGITDEKIITKYDYITGKLLSINNIDIIVQNSWEVLLDEHALKGLRWIDMQPFKWEDYENVTWGELEDSGREYATGAIPGLAPYEVVNKGTLSTGEFLVDGKFYDKYGNYNNKFVDQTDGKILYEQDENNPPKWNGETIKETRIYQYSDIAQQEIYTGKYFDVSNPAKVLNTYCELLDGGIFGGYYISNDNYTIYESSTGKDTGFMLKEYEMLLGNDSKWVWKVYSSKDNIKYNWHVDMDSRYFFEDTDGQIINRKIQATPFSETTYIGKKAYIMKPKLSEDDTSLRASQFYLNRYGDIIDNAGNIILSKKDRYKVSDSTMIGFSEVHDDSKQLSTFDGTNILGRDWSFLKDDDIENIWGKQEANDFDNYDRVEDKRYSFNHFSFDIGNPIREYTGSELIRFLSNEDLKEIVNEDGYFNVPLFVTDFDKRNASGVLKIKTDTPLVYNLGDIFQSMNIRFENKLPNDELKLTWNIYIDWETNYANRSLFNLNDLENPIQLLHCGTIEKRTLLWTGNPIIVSPKIYDGTTNVHNRFGINNAIEGNYQDVINKDNSKPLEVGSISGVFYYDSFNQQNIHTGEIQVFQKDVEVSYCNFINGLHFKLANVPVGTYKIIVSKNNHTKIYIENVVVTKDNETVISKENNKYTLYAGDFDGDNKITESDLQILNNNLYGNVKYDLNDDNIVDDKDVEKLTDNIGKQSLTIRL